MAFNENKHVHVPAFQSTPGKLETLEYVGKYPENPATHRHHSSHHKGVYGPLSAALYFSWPRQKGRAVLSIFLSLRGRQQVPGHTFAEEEASIERCLGLQPERAML